MDKFAALRLQIEWGADEALESRPLDRRTAGNAARAREAGPAAGGLREAVSGHNTPVHLASGPPPGMPLSVRQVAAAFAESRGMGLADTAMNMAFFTGPESADLLLLGDVASADDDRAGTPFAGAAGLLLDRMLASIGLRRDTLLLVNLIPWRPPGGRPPNSAEVAACLPYVHHLLAVLRPRHTVLLGTLPFRALIADGASGRQRGRWNDLTLPQDGASLPALPMHHPATLLSRPDLKRSAWGDLRLLRRTLDGMITS